MQASGQLRRYEHHIGGAAVPPGSHAYLHTKSVWISTDLDLPDPFVRR